METIFIHNADTNTHIRLHNVGGKKWRFGPWFNSISLWKECEEGKKSKLKEIGFFYSRSYIVFFFIYICTKLTWHIFFRFQVNCTCGAFLLLLMLDAWSFRFRQILSLSHFTTVPGDTCLEWFGTCLNTSISFENHGTQKKGKQFKKKPREGFSSNVTFINSRNVERSVSIHSFSHNKCYYFIYRWKILPIARKKSTIVKLTSFPSPNGYNWFGICCIFQQFYLFLDSHYILLRNVSIMMQFGPCGIATIVICRCANAITKENRPILFYSAGINSFTMQDNDFWCVNYCRLLLLRWVCINCWWICLNTCIFSSRFFLSSPCPAH